MSPSPLVTPSTRLFIDSLRQKYGVPGVSIGVVARRDGVEGSTWETETLGLGVRDSDDHPVEPDTIFCIASASKVLTAFSIGILIDRKTKLPDGELLSWETKVKKALPDWELQDKWAEEHLEIGDLLSHMSGLPRHDILLKTEDNAARIVKCLKHVKPCREARKVFQYANVNYFTIGQVIANLTGMRYIDFVKKNILEPLGMGDSTYGDTSATGKRSDGFYHIDRDLAKAAAALKKGEWDDASLIGRAENLGWWITRGTGDAFAAAGSLSTTANDMVKWIKELLEPTVFPSSIKEEIVKSRVASEQTPSYADMGIQTYGYGQTIYQYRGHRVEAHGGGLAGQCCFHLRIPGRCGMMIMTNDNDFGYQVALLSCFRIVDDLLGLYPVDWEDRLILSGMKEVKEDNPPPENARAPPDFVEGEYFDPGYGNLIVKKVEDIDHGEEMRGLLDKFPVSDIKADRTKQVYVAETDRGLQSHLVFIHFDGPIYIWVRLVLRKITKPKGDQKYLVERWGKGKAVVTKEGIGMFENYWGLLDVNPTQKATEENVKSEAEVWYARK